MYRSQDSIVITDTLVTEPVAMIADCNTSPPVEGSVRLLGGFGTPCDPVHSSFVEVFHLEEWGAICTGGEFPNKPQVADVVCRQLGFPHGTTVDPTTNPASSDYSDEADEAEEPQTRFWLNEVTCSGPEAMLTDCQLGLGFRTNNAGCTNNPSRLTVACRLFAVSEALEDVTTPGARASPLISCHCPQ